ncbi:hypothetical protein [Marinobacter sp. NSM]|uniref:hypothetical protein n=1 Tax=Marinobacter sp. NSM TaxID=3458004 RepID=UPI0040366955
MDEQSVVSIEEFGQVVASKDYIALVRRWQRPTFYAVFSKTEEGDETPALVEVQDHLAFIASPDRAGDLGQHPVSACGGIYRRNTASG